MIESATGVVLRTQRLTETSLIVRWLTAESGRLATVAKGARRTKSPFAGKLDLFVEADFTFSRSPRSDLHGLREVSVNEFHLPLRDDVGRVQSAAYCTALLEQATETDTPLPGLFELFTGLLAQLSRSKPRPRLIFAFELKLLDALGLFPSLDRTRLKPATRELVIALNQGSWSDVENLRPGPASVKELGPFLQGFLIHHLGKLPTGRAMALHA
jgi:DNA repair protein RecO (recombination protein O)